MKLITTPPRGARLIRTYGDGTTIADVERDVELVALLDRRPLVTMTGSIYALYVEQTIEELGAEISAENAPRREIFHGSDRVPFEISDAGRAVLELETVPSYAEGAE